MTYQRHERWVGRVLGEARDWDRFNSQFLPDSLDAEHDAGRRALLLRAATPARTAAQQTLGVINNTFTATALAERSVKGARLDLGPAVDARAEELRYRNDTMSP